MINNETAHNPSLPNPKNAATYRAGRIAADELGATPFGRPEDIEVGILKNGNEVLYFTATSEAAVYSVEMLNSKKAIVREFASNANTSIAHKLAYM